jgi:hypothetical protein
MKDVSGLLPLLDSMGLKYQQLDELCVRMGFTAPHTSYEVLLIAGGPLLSLAATAESRLPAGRMDEAVKLANLLNATRIRWGAFWVHPERRNLGFELALPSLNGVTREELGMALGAIALNAFWPAFARVAWAGLDAAAALDASAKEIAEDDEDDEDDDPSGDARPSDEPGPEVSF